MTRKTIGKVEQQKWFKRYIFVVDVNYNIEFNIEFNIWREIVQDGLTWLFIIISVIIIVIEIIIIAFPNLKIYKQLHDTRKT